MGVGLTSGVPGARWTWGQRWRELNSVGQSPWGTWGPPQWLAEAPSMTDFSSTLSFLLSSCSLGHLTSVFVQIYLKIVLLAYADTIDRACGELPLPCVPLQGRGER